MGGDGQAFQSEAVYLPGIMCFQGVYMSSQWLHTQLQYCF